jgi:hypothetical protein
MQKKNSLAAALRNDADARKASMAAGSATPAAGTRKQIGIRLDPEVIRQLKQLALDEGTSLQDLICEGINGVFQARGLPPIAS